MTTTMELKRSNLVLPTSGYELDEDEMSYVEGGSVYISYMDIKSVVQALGATSKGWIALALTLTSNWGLVTWWVNSLPVVGQIAFGLLLVAGIAAAGIMATAYLKGKGIELGGKKVIEIR